MDGMRTQKPPPSTVAQSIMMSVSAGRIKAQLFFEGLGAAP
jgi:hypothetical protein